MLRVVFQDLKSSGDMSSSHFWGCAELGNLLPEGCIIGYIGCCGGVVGCGAPIWAPCCLWNPGGGVVYIQFGDAYAAGPGPVGAYAAWFGPGAPVGVAPNMVKFDSLHCSLSY